MKDRQALLVHTYREKRKTPGKGVVASIVEYYNGLAKILNQSLADISGFGDAGKPDVKLGSGFEQMYSPTIWGVENLSLDPNQPEPPMNPGELKSFIWRNAQCL